jgi:5S rRNA maturation endonuclease (ribonuclease M5)
MWAGIQLNVEERAETLIKLVEKLAEASKETAIIVEGRKDVIALRELGVTGKIICLQNSGKALTNLVEEISDTQNSIIILTDFDSYGRELVGRLLSSLEENRVKTNLVFWRRIKSLVRHEIKDIEGLPRYMERLKSTLKL